MTLKNAFFYLLTGAALAACQPERKPQVFNQNGVSFAYPGDWEVDPLEEVAPGAFTLNCEKSGLGSSGLVSISWFADSLDLDKVRGLFQQQFATSPIYKMSDVKFAPTVAGFYGAHPARRALYRLKMLSVPQSGSLNAFHLNRRTFMVLLQQADEDSAANRAGFRRIAQSLASELPR